MLKRKNFLLNLIIVSLLFIALFLIYLSFSVGNNGAYNNNNKHLIKHDGNLNYNENYEKEQYFLNNISKEYLIKNFEPYSSLDPEIFNEILKIADNKEIYVIDVRTPEEYNSYRINKSININLYDEDFEEKINKFDKNKIYLIYCRSGHRSAIAKEKMKKLGFKRRYIKLD